MESSSRAGAFGARELIRAVSGWVLLSHPPAEAAKRLAQARANVNEALAEASLPPLLGHLEEHPRDAEALLALLLIGSAHPRAFEELRCSAPGEAARLVELLESEGACGWAAAVRDLFGVGKESVPRALPEPRRRCISLRPKVFQRLLAAGLLAALLGGGVWREVALRDRWAAVPPAVPGDLESVEARLASLHPLVEESGPWLGLPGVAAERLRLEGERKRLARAELVLAEEAERARELRWLEAERARERGLLALEAGSPAEARRWFAEALERGGERWSGGPQLAVDIMRLSDAQLVRGAADLQRGDVVR